MEPLHLVRLGRDGDRAGPLEVAGDVVAAERGLEGIEVLAAELVEAVDLVGEAIRTVRPAVRQRGGTETAVAPGRSPPDPAALEQHHVAGGVTLLGEDRTPQSGVATADDAEVGLGVRVERRPRPGSVRPVEPVRHGRGLAQGRVPGRPRCRWHARIVPGTALGRQGSPATVSKSAPSAVQAPPPWLLATPDLDSPLGRTMSRLLHRLGRGSALHPWRTLLLWALAATASRHS